MTDITERLRANAKSVDCLQDMDPDLLYAAANEIERLRAENAKFQLAIKRQADRCDALKDHAIDLTNQINATTPPSVSQIPEGCMWVVTKGGRRICQPPKTSKPPTLPSVQNEIGIPACGGPLCNEMDHHPLCSKAPTLPKPGEE